MFDHKWDDIGLMLMNPGSNAKPHNVEFHAATWASGGGASILVDQEEQVGLRYKAIRAGKSANPPAEDAPTWFIGGGSAGAEFCSFLQSSVYAYVNQKLIEAMELGVTTHFLVDDALDNDLMKQADAPASIPTH